MVSYMSQGSIQSRYCTCDLWRQSVIANRQRTKHIDITHHFIRDHLQSNHIVIKWIPTAEQQADLLTKMMPTKQFVTLRDKLYLREA